MQYQPNNIAGRTAKIFLHHPLTFFLGCVVVILGYVSLMITPREEDPQIAISGGTILVMLPGASAKEVRNVIIKPLEKKIKEIQGIEDIYGVAKENMGILNVMYTIGEDRESSNLKLYDKVMQNMDSLPKGALPPLIRPFDIDIDIPILSLGFYLKPDAKGDYVDLTKRVEEIRTALGGIENVAKLDIKGGAYSQYTIEVNPQKLTHFNLSLGQVAHQLQSLMSSHPNVQTHTKEGKLSVFGIESMAEDVQSMRHLIVGSNKGAPIYLQDIATITRDQEPQNYQKAYILSSDEENLLNRQVTLTLSKLKGSNAVTIANRALEELENFKPLLESEGIGLHVSRNYGERADKAVNSLVQNLIVSIGIIALLLIFTLGWRESLIVTFLVPAIFAVTLFVALITDQTINRITLFAFLLSLGILVDAAIIVVENIHRHLNDSKNSKLSTDEIVIRATDEIGAPTNIATIAIVLTMIPMAFVGDMMGQFMRPIPLNVPVTIFASLVIAYIFAPYLARKVLKRPKGADNENL